MRTTGIGMRVFMCVLMGLACAYLIGCDAHNKSAVTQVPEQRLETPTVTSQEQGTQGTVINNNFYFGAAGESPGLVDLSDGKGEQLPYKTVAARVDGEPLTTNMGWVMAGNTINIPITTGGTTPSVTGTATGSASGTQTPTQTSNANPVQTVTPEFTSAVPISVGLPGSAVSGSANAAGSGGTMGNPTASPTQTPNYAMLKVPQEYASQAIGFLEQFFGILQQGKKPVLTSQPAQPSP